LKLDNTDTTITVIKEFSHNSLNIKPKYKLRTKTLGVLVVAGGRSYPTTFIIVTLKSLLHAIIQFKTVDDPLKKLLSFALLHFSLY
jgi:hypothetical protein